MSEQVHQNRLVSLAAAIVAVLAALGTLAAHHRSIVALSLKNQAILAQARASDGYNGYEARSIRAHLYQALIASGISGSASVNARMKLTADDAEATALASQRRARALETESKNDEQRSETTLRSYETLETATSFFEIAIVLISISALARTRLFLMLGLGLGVAGIVFFWVGYFQGH